MNESARRKTAVQAAHHQSGPVFLTFIVLRFDFFFYFFLRLSGGQREREREIGIFRTIFSLFLFGMFLTIETKSNCRFESNIPSPKRRERRRDSFFFSNFCPVRWYIYLWWSMEKKNIKVFFFFFLCSRKFAGRVFPPFRPHHSDRSQIFVPFFFSLFDFKYSIKSSEANQKFYHFLLLLVDFPKRIWRKCAQQILMLPHHPSCHHRIFIIDYKNKIFARFQTHIHG